MFCDFKLKGYTMKTITLKKMNISKASSKEMSDCLNLIFQMVEKQKPFIATMQKYFTNSEIYTFLFENSGLKEKIETYNKLRNQFFKKHKFLPDDALKNVSISNNVIQVNFDNKSLPNSSLVLSQDNFQKLMDELTYICYPFSFNGTLHNALTSEQVERLEALDEELFVLESFQNFNFNHAITQTIDVIQKIQVPTYFQNQWQTFLMMHSMFSTMHYQIQEIKDGLSKTNDRINNLQNTLNSNFQKINQTFLLQEQKISKIIQQVNKNTSELDILHDRHRDMPGYYYTRELDGYRSVGYGTSYETDYDIRWSHYYQVPVYKEVKHSCTIPAKPTMPLEDNRIHKHMSLDEIKSTISNNPQKVQKEVLRHKILIAKKRNTNTYRLIHDNISELTPVANAVLSSAIQFKIQGK